MTTIKDACAAFDKRVIKNALNELNQKKWPRKIGESLDLMAGLLLGGDFEEVANIAEGLMERTDIVCG